MIQINVYTQQKQTHKCKGKKRKTMVTKGDREGRGENWGYRIERYKILCKYKIDKQQAELYSRGNHYLITSFNLV